MPLRDHFRAPLDNLISWEGFHGQWPGAAELPGVRDVASARCMRVPQETKCAKSTGAS